MILLNAGLKTRNALGLTIITYIASFAGVFTGVALGEELNIVEWIFGVTAGMFLYIALVELVSFKFIIARKDFTTKLTVLFSKYEAKKSEGWQDWSTEAAEFMTHCSSQASSNCWALMLPSMQSTGVPLTERGVSELLPLYGASGEAFHPSGFAQITLIY